MYKMLFFYAFGQYNHGILIEKRLHTYLELPMFLTVRNYLIFILRGFNSTYLKRMSYVNYFVHLSNN